MQGQYRNPADLQREKTEPKPEIHEERNERAAELKDQRVEQWHGDNEARDEQEDNAPADQ